MITEADIEQITLDLLREQGYHHLPGRVLLEGAFAERSTSEVLLLARLETAIDRLNPHLPPGAKEEALRKLRRTDSPELLAQNEAWHRHLTEGVDLTFRTPEGDIRSDKAWLLDFQNPQNNEWLAVNQLDVAEGQYRRRPDVVLYCNGIPLVVIELKNATNERADTVAAFNQIETYKKEIPVLFAPVAFSVISDYWFAQAGTLSSGYKRFMEWKSKDGDLIVDVDEDRSNRSRAELPYLIEGMLRPDRLLDLLRHFIVFEKTRDKTSKKLAAYHQYFAANRAIETTIAASRPTGDKRAGVVWHTQGSGKSLSMVFYTGKLVLEQAMNNPTIVVLTDRNDLDQQLFETFGNCQQLLRQTPVQAETRVHLRELLQVASGGVVFTTIQKFFPEKQGDTYPTLSERDNIVVVADEAHRSQYDFIDGYARHMRDALPNASFIGFTGTPIEKTDADTRAVFGEYVHIYDIQQAVEDGATVRIYYESRLAKIELDEEVHALMDSEIEQLTEGQETAGTYQKYLEWTSKEAIIGSERRLRRVAQDLVEHFEKRTEILPGKAMIVCMSRRICVALHDKIKAIRPDWYSPKDSEGKIKVIMTGSASDPLDWQEHIRNKPRRKAIGDRLKDPGNPLQLVIVRDMWLTGFDAPPLHTLYVDKPMGGHNLMQAIARVNRVFKDKTGGLVVDYIGIAQDLKNALSVYTDSGGKGQPAYDKSAAVDKMIELYEVVVYMFNGHFKYKKYFALDQAKDRLDFTADAVEFIMGLEDGPQRFKQTVTRLSQAFGLANPHEEADKIRDELAFFQAMRSRIAKLTRKEGLEKDQAIETAIRQIVSQALISDEVIDIFDAAGIEKPEISILSDEFLEDIRNMKRKNTALELLRRLLNEQLKTSFSANVIQMKKFSELLADSVRRYQNNLISTAEALQEAIDFAHSIKDAMKRGEKLGLREDELAFYDALHVSETAEAVLGDKVLREIALELVESLKKSVTIDWNIKESVQAGIRIRIKRILRRHKYPPDASAKAVQAVMEQTEVLARLWAK
ncbi:MAG TPA: type I restriction endonuclease subunit R [Bacteroidetes bacterium]|nr:type I restriction endonuclease subunit R [Bacteroidota bacterium]